MCWWRAKLFGLEHIFEAQCSDLLQIVWKCFQWEVECGASKNYFISLFCQMHTILIYKRTRICEPNSKLLFLSFLLFLLMRIYVHTYNCHMEIRVFVKIVSYQVSAFGGNKPLACSLSKPTNNQASGLWFIVHAKYICMYICVYANVGCIDFQCIGNLAFLVFFYHDNKIKSQTITKNFKSIKAKL